LSPTERDTQSELNAIISSITGREFAHANRVRYLLNDQFYSAFKKMILDTEYYHVLVIHDFRDRSSDKQPDLLGWEIALDGYLDAFIAAIEEIDREERDVLPEFMIFLDQHYYELNESRRIISFLERMFDPGKIELEDMRLEVKAHAHHERLRGAIARSPIFGVKGDAELRRLFKVHVNITHPHDPTFTDDWLMRDHRKMAFHDVFEEDPSLGEAIYAGLGVGEAYVGPHWDDRSLMVQGDDLVRIKTAARELFLSQGYSESEVPYYLRAGEFSSQHVARVDALRAEGWNASVLSVMNDTGYGRKEATVLKAAIYSLMPAGSLLLTPDSLWASDFWAGMMAGAALRGCHVFAIAPAAKFAPSGARLTLELIHDTLGAMMLMAERLRDEIEAVGGSLRVGLYTYDDDVCNVRDRIGAYLSGVAQPTYPRHGLRFSLDAMKRLETEREQLASEYDGPVHLAKPADRDLPRLHMKAQFFATDSALDVMNRPEWTDVLLAYLDTRRRETSERSERGGGITRSVLEALRLPQSGGDGVMTFATVGSHNQDRRSMFLDGEALVAIAGHDALITLIDFTFMMGEATWPQDLTELARHYPPKSGFWRRMARWLRDLI